MTSSSLESIYRGSPSWLQGLMLDGYSVGIWWHRYGRPYRRAVRELMEHDGWPRERLRLYQDERAREVVRVAYESTKYYREVMDAHGVSPADVKGVDDLRLLPLLEKTTVRESAEAMMTAAHPQRGWLHGHTSGTTGTPLGLWYDRQTCVQTNAVDRRQKLWGGMRRGDWIGLFLGRVIVPTTQSGSPYWRTNHIQRQLWFSSFHMSDDRLPEYVAEIRRRRLRFLEGYPSTLFILARHLLDRGERLPMRSVFTSSETLHDVQKEAICKAFQCEVFDFYGHAERAIFASECDAHDGKHVAEEFGFVELVDAAGQVVGPGETGYLVGTSLHNLAMPMIRYRTSDLSRIIEEPCACGRTSRRVAAVTTKAEDIVMTPDGRLISPSVLTHPFKPLEGLRKSQIIQEGNDLLRIRLVIGTRFTDEDRTRLTEALAERVGPGMRILIEEVEDIPSEASGKFRWVISKVDHSRRFEWDAN